MASAGAGAEAGSFISTLLSASALHNISNDAKKAALGKEIVLPMAEPSAALSELRGEIVGWNSTLPITRLYPGIMSGATTSHLPFKELAKKAGYSDVKKAKGLIKIVALPPDADTDAQPELMHLAEYLMLMQPQGAIEAQIRAATTEILAAKDLEPASKATPENLYKLRKLQKREIKRDGLRYVYRVCRPDQSGAIEAHGKLVATAPRDYSGDSIIQWLYDAYCHVRNGTRASRSAFISATESAESALFWSRCGLQRVIRIDLKQLPKSSPYLRLCWNNYAWVGGDGDKNQAARFATSSREVLIFGEIPPSAYTLVAVSMHNVAPPKAFLRAHPEKKGAEIVGVHFPDDLSGLPIGGFTVEQSYDNTNTRPVRVAWKAGSTGERQFILKSGWRMPNQPDYKFNDKQVHLEFIALVSYGLMGVLAPSVCLYQSQVLMDGEPVCIVTQLLTEYIWGEPITPADNEDMKAVQKGIPADIVLCNFDALGEDYRNLVSGPEGVFRVDGGASFGLYPDGKEAVELRKNFYEQPAKNMQKTLNLLSEGGELFAAAGDVEGAAGALADEGHTGVMHGAGAGGRKPSVRVKNGPRAILVGMWKKAAANKRNLSTLAQMMYYGSPASASSSSFSSGQRTFRGRLNTRTDLILPGYKEIYEAIEARLREMHKWASATDTSSDDDSSSSSDSDESEEGGRKAGGTRRQRPPDITIAPAHRAFETKRKLRKTDELDDSDSEASEEAPALQVKRPRLETAGGGTLVPTTSPPRTSTQPKQPTSSPPSALRGETTGSGNASQRVKKCVRIVDTSPVVYPSPPWPASIDRAAGEGSQASAAGGTSIVGQDVDMNTQPVGASSLLCARSSTGPLAQTQFMRFLSSSSSGASASAAQHATEPHSHSGTSLASRPDSNAVSSSRAALASPVKAAAAAKGTPSPASSRKKGKSTAVVRAQMAREAQKRKGLGEHGIVALIGKKGNAELPVESDTVRVVDVTSRGELPYRQLSPFYPFSSAVHPGRPGFPVPGMPGAFSYTVEGVWQGLKVFPKAGVDASKFKVTNMQKLKRSARVLGGNPLGHYNAGKPDLLGYIPARKQIYVPLYRSQLDSLQPVVDELADWLRNRPDRELYLLDYYVNDDVDEASVPLAHAGLVQTRLLSLLQASNGTGFVGPQADLPGSATLLPLAVPAPKPRNSKAKGSVVAADTDDEDM